MTAVKLNANYAVAKESLIVKSAKVAASIKIPLIFALAVKAQVKSTASSVITRAQLSAESVVAQGLRIDPCTKFPAGM